jgi:hypothetical protein
VGKITGSLYSHTYSKPLINKKKLMTVYVPHITNTVKVIDTQMKILAISNNQSSRKKKCGDMFEAKR